jgi:hypothetical protein
MKATLAAGGREDLAGSHHVAQPMPQVFDCLLACQSVQLYVAVVLNHGRGALG